MAIALVDSEVVGFADGSGGHVYTIPDGAPAVDELDVLCVNSNTTVSTPSGFTSRVSAVANQGAYIFTRKASGGEGSTVTITTSGDHNTTLTWSRWTGTDAYSDGNSAQANNTNGTTLPAASTGTLAATGMLVIAFGALHNHDGSLATSPSWSNGFTTLESGSQGSAGTSQSCVAFTAYKTNAGTASETINSVSWTNNSRNRYALWIAVTAAAGGGDATVTPSAVAATASVPASTASASSTATPSAVAAAVSVPAASVSTGSTAAAAVVAAVAAIGAAGLSAGSTVSPTAVSAVAAVPAAQASAGATVAVAVTAAAATVPAAAVATGATVIANTVTGQATVNPAGVSVGSTLTPASISATASVPAVTVSTVTARNLALETFAPRTKWRLGAPFV